MNIVLFQPLIPQNTGTIGRLAVCTDNHLHLIKPLGFKIDEKKIKKAGMDYWPHVKLHIHESWDEFLSNTPSDKTMVFCTTKCKKTIYDHEFSEDDYLIFGNESHGLPPDFYEKYQENLFTIPMRGDHLRSHNLANSVSIVTYEAIRQISYT
ncbi:tRNA (cytidine(34)-2'-O)-methyltransferase [Lentisphaera marina]|uniref:tRNA (cytidine(34)-2'-O)-methyltransferase n=1 Tax=Lentisphaera marina TaxID=1111041 RepID=UPI002365D295|nr:tRNA (cytidine(34)-2'-O)-methyltransferase [Lentisphaera marina]MDD7986976.1 tRNA (cytidine(34)-2'-O)-methyltransferase [Lentisphaera marina]